MVRRRVLAGRVISMCSTLLMLAACGAPDAADGPASTPLPAPATTPAPAGTVGDALPEALQFSAPLVGGGTFDGAAIADLPVAFWFWAPT